MGFKNLPAWLKGGIIGGISGLVIGGLLYLYTIFHVTWFFVVGLLFFGIISGICATAIRVLKPWVTGGIIGIIIGALFYLFSIFSANMDDPLIASGVHGVSQALIVILLILGVIIGFIAGKFKNREIN